MDLKYVLSEERRSLPPFLPDTEMSLVVIIPFRLNALEDRDADLGPVSNDTSGLQMTDVCRLGVPVEDRDMGVGVSADDRALDARELDGTGEIPVLVYGLDGGGRDRVKVDPLE